MADAKLEKILRLVLRDRWRLGSHALDKIEVGEVARGEIQHALLNGKIERVQRDEKKVAQVGFRSKPLARLSKARTDKSIS